VLTPLFRHALTTVVTSLLAFNVVTLQPAIAESEEATATASGLVMVGTDSTGIPDLTIRLYRATEDADHPWELKATTYTVGGRMKPVGPNCTVGDCHWGDWSVNIPPGLYRMTVNELDDDTGSWHIWSSYDSASDDNLVLVKPDVNYAFFPWGHLSPKGGGVSMHVLDQCNQGIPNAWVDTYDASGQHTERLVREQTNNSGDGTARTPLMPARIKITDRDDSNNFAWVGNAATFDAAKTFDLSKGQFIWESQPVVLHRTVFPQPTEQPTIAGFVSDPQGISTPGVTVRLYRKTYDDNDPWKLEATTVTSASGSYSVTLPVGEYRVSANEPGDTGTPVAAWGTAYFGGLSFDTAATKCATSPYDGGTNMVVPFAGRAISGTVTDPRGKPIAGATVETYAASAPTEGAATLLRTTKTDINGQYTTHGNGDPVKLKFLKAPTSLPEWFDNASTIEGAVSIPSDAGADAIENDAVLADVQMTSTRAPEIKGRSAYGLTVGRFVGLYSPHPVKLTYQWMRRTSTLTSITGERSSSYRVRVTDIGKRLVLRETATPLGYYPGVKPIVRYSPYSERVKRDTTISTRASYSSGHVKIRVTVKIAGIASPRGTVVVRLQKYKSNGYRDGSAKSKSVTFRDGKATVSFTGTRGSYSWSASYAGTTTIAAARGGDRGFIVD